MYEARTLPRRCVNLSPSLPVARLHSRPPVAMAPLPVVRIFAVVLALVCVQHCAAYHCACFKNSADSSYEGVMCTSMYVPRVITGWGRPQNAWFSIDCSSCSVDYNCTRTVPVDRLPGIAPEAAPTADDAAASASSLRGSHTEWVTHHRGEDTPSASQHGAPPSDAAVATSSMPSNPVHCCCTLGVRCARTLLASRALTPAWVYVGTVPFSFLQATPRKSTTMQKASTATR